MARTFGTTASDGACYTLADLRELVEDTAHLPGDATVRGQASLRGQDFTNPAGLVLRGIAVEYERRSESG